MTYTLKKLNVERVVAEKSLAEKLIADGWTLLPGPATVAADTSDAAMTEANTVLEIKDYAAAHQIDLKGARSKAELLAVVNGNRN